MSWWVVVILVWVLFVVGGLCWLAWAYRYAKTDRETWDGGDGDDGSRRDD